MTDKRDEDEKANALASERYADYKRGWLSGSNGKPLTPSIDTPEPKHIDWFRRGFKDGKAAFRENVRRISKDLELVSTQGTGAEDHEPYMRAFAEVCTCARVRGMANDGAVVEVVRSPTCSAHGEIRDHEPWFDGWATAVGGEKRPHESGTAAAVKRVHVALEHLRETAARVARESEQERRIEETRRSCKHGNGFDCRLCEADAELVGHTEPVPEWTTHTDGTQTHVSGKAQVYRLNVDRWRWDANTNNIAASFDSDGGWGTSPTAEKARADALDYLARHPNEPEKPVT
jgi:hypothetical protein